MALEQTPLDPARLSPAAQKALASPASRAMAARGLVPLPPRDQLIVLYQLAVDLASGGPAAAQVAQTARGSILGLPDALLAAALADPALDPRVLDAFAELVGDRGPVFAALIDNAAVADPTIAYLASTATTAEIDRIATNEQRLLRHPEIIGAMYRNRLVRMSTIDRVVELAVRNGVRVPGLAAWDEIARAIDLAPRSAATDDAAFATAAKTATTDDDAALTEGDTNTAPDDEVEAKWTARDPQHEAQVGRLSVPAKIRLAQLGNATTRGLLVRDPIKMVASAAVKAGGVTEFEAARYASNHTLDDTVIRYIAQRRDWSKVPAIRFALCRNPKTPLVETTKFLPYLRDKELASLAKSKGVPSAVAAQARKLVTMRGPGKR